MEQVVSRQLFLEIGVKDKNIFSSRLLFQGNDVLNLLSYRSKGQLAPPTGSICGI